jgi:hypothetical protein
VPTKTPNGLGASMFAGELDKGAAAATEESTSEGEHDSSSSALASVGTNPSSDVPGPSLYSTFGMPNSVG